MEISEMHRGIEVSR